VTVILRAVVGPSDETEERRTIEVVAASFQQGRAEIDALMPPGWRRIHIVTG
jgi:hypothetical protein